MRKTTTDMMIQGAELQITQVTTHYEEGEERTLELFVGEHGRELFIQIELDDPSDLLEQLKDGLRWLRDGDGLS